VSLSRKGGGLGLTRGSRWGCLISTVVGRCASASSYVVG